MERILRRNVIARPANVGFGDNERMLRPTLRIWPVLAVIALAVPDADAQVRYQLLLKGGHVIDPRNQVDAVMDVAVADGKIAAVRADIDPAEARTVVDVERPLRHAGSDRRRTSTSLPPPA